MHFSLALYLFWFPSYVPICRKKMLKTAKFDLWSALVTWSKNDWISFVIIVYALSNAAYRVPLRGPGAELEAGGGVFKHPPGQARSAPSTGPVRGNSAAKLLHFLALHKFPYEVIWQWSDLIWNQLGLKRSTVNQRAGRSKYSCIPNVLENGNNGKKTRREWHQTNALPSYFLVLVALRWSLYVYVAGTLENQAFCKMPDFPGFLQKA